MNNLTTRESREIACKQIEDSFLNTMRENHIEISNTSICRVRKNSIKLGIYTQNNTILNHTSCIELYAMNLDLEDDFQIGSDRNEISVGSSGSFTPDDKDSYWRTIHAASILKNWNVVSEIVNSHCKLYCDLINNK